MRYPVRCIACSLGWLVLLVAGPLHAQPAPADTLPDGFVHLRDVAPTIVQEMRYHGPYNFVGEPIDGYEAPTCIVTAPAARALAKAQADLERRGLGLKVYDCYRPQRAVDHFVRWARNLNDERTKTAFYPDEPKRYLFSRGYIARRSGHSRGSTVDLSVVALPRRAADAVPLARLAPRLHGARRRTLRRDGARHGDGLRLPQPALGHRKHPGVGEAALANRRMLREAMMQAGFRNYSKEWWHYTLRGEPFPDTYFDFPVR